jgi:hypothetical protein
MPVDLDPRIAYAANCTWWDSVAKAGSRNVRDGDAVLGLPCCPICGSPLFEVPDEATWWAGVEAHEAAGNIGYRGYIEWMRGRCYPDDVTAVDVYYHEVNPERSAS